jgi:hypothetical protein
MEMPKPAPVSSPVNPNAGMPGKALAIQREQAKKAMMNPSRAATDPSGRVRTGIPFSEIVRSENSRDIKAGGQKMKNADPRSDIGTMGMQAKPKVPPRDIPIEPPTPEPVLAPNPKSASALNKQQQFAEMMPRLANQAPGIKAGGQVKKMAQGGYAKADGVAKKGKTQPKMVKMASGGFVKTADGCAQRGKTKAFQVKMKRGGMC